jgi:uncharacterized membrane protein
VGYGAQSPRRVTVSNIGAQPTGRLTIALSGVHGDSFTLSGGSISGIGVNSTGAFTVVPNTGLAVGTYTAAVTVSGDNGISARSGVSFTVNPATAAWGISLSETGAHIFPATAPEAITVTVANIGNRSTGNLTVALSGATAAFTLSKNSMSLGVGGSDTFTVVPNTGLSAGTYTATVAVSGGNGLSGSFNVSFTTPGTSDPSLSLSAASHVFPAATVGYGALAECEVTVTNTGNQDTGNLTIALSGANRGSFTLSEASISGLGGSGSFIVRPRAGLAEGTYTATATVSDGNGLSESCSFSFTVHGTDPVHGLTLGTTGYTFPSAAAGYASRTAFEVPVTNTGNQPTGNLTVALSGADRGSFTLSGTSIVSLNTGGSNRFTVAPNTGLSARTHGATVTVTGDNGISEGFDVSFTVKSSASPGISLSAGNHVFPEASTGYGAPSPVHVTVTNTGAQDTGNLTVALSGADRGSFTLSKTSINSLGVGGSGTFTVAPNTGLAARTYRATVTVSGGNGVSEGFDVSFTVKSSELDYAISLSETGTHIFPEATAGYSAPEPLGVTVSNTGAQPTGSLTVALSGTNGVSFTLSKTSINNLNVGGNDTFTVAPKTGLPAGTHTATVTVTGGHGLSKAFDVGFSVKSAGGGGGGGGTPGGDGGDGVPAPGGGSGGDDGGGSCTGAPGLVWLLPAVFVMRRKRR